MYIMDEQQSFLLSFKICVLYLVRTKQTSLQKRLRALVVRCTHENRKASSDAEPLRQVLRREMHALLGDANWNQAERILRGYCAMKNIVLTE